MVLPTLLLLLLLLLPPPSSSQNELSGLGNCAGLAISAEAWPDPSWRDRLRGSSVTTCDLTLKADGRCDLTNNMNQNECDYDGGDCCMTTCITNCMEKQSRLGLGDFTYLNPTGIMGACTHMCGNSPGGLSSCPYMCLDDRYQESGVTYTNWCQHTRGQKRQVSVCYNTRSDVAEAMRQCIMDDKSHGNELTSSYNCGNQTMQCTVADVESQNGCHLHPKYCTNSPCCQLAAENGWIDLSVKVLPTICDIVRGCDNNCMALMAECIRLNKACKGGCCQCSEGSWYGFNCDVPLCWPKCQHGMCISPGMCHCDEGWSGPSCEAAMCNPPCKSGQGVCVAPETCECFYGWGGPQCETPLSHPPCVNGDAIAPDVCKCKEGWGGRLCDYPLCQSYPVPSSDCGDHGRCVAPYVCECEPGWEILAHIGKDGKKILPFWWKGRIVDETLPATHMVWGDTRFNQTSENQYRFISYNAFKCERPNCRLLKDSFCRKCADVTGECLECDPGYFLAGPWENTSSLIIPGRCHLCSMRWKRCMYCDPWKCLACDPMFVLKDGECVSDGLIELSSPEYHVFADEKYVAVDVIRTFDSIDAVYSAARDEPLRVLFMTADGTAKSRTGPELRLADYEQMYEYLYFGPPHFNKSTGVTTYPEREWLFIDAYDGNMRFVNHSSPESLPDKASFDAIDFRREAKSNLTTTRRILIPIFNNAKYDTEILEFKVRIFVEPLALRGSLSRLTPEVGGYLSQLELGSDAYKGGPFDLVSEATVFIWDRSAATPDRAELLPTSDLFTEAMYTSGQSVGTVTTIELVAMKCVRAETSTGECVNVGPVTVAEKAAFIVNTEPRGRGTDHMLGDSILIDHQNGQDNSYRAYSIPFVAGPYRISLGQAHPGVFGSYYKWTPEPPAGALPDVYRIDHEIDFSWKESKNAPRFVRWKGHVHFDCLELERTNMPGDAPTYIGIAISRDTQAKLWWKNAGLILDVSRPSLPVDSDDEDWKQPDVNHAPASVPDCRHVEGLYCFDVLGPTGLITTPYVGASRAVAGETYKTVYPFHLTWQTSAEHVNRPAGITFAMFYRPPDTIPGYDPFFWGKIPQECLYASVETRLSPVEGLTATAGNPNAVQSLLAGLNDEETLEGTANNEIYAKVILQDSTGNLVIDSSFASNIIVFLEEPHVEASIAWDASKSYFVGTLTIPGGTPETTTLLAATLDGIPITGSGLPVQIKASTSDFTRAHVVGNYTEARINEERCFSIYSFDFGGNPRNDGGDQYLVSIAGPRHDPKPTLEFIATDLDDGSYQACFQLILSGFYDMNISLAGDLLPQNPFNITISGVLDPDILGPGGVTYHTSNVPSFIRAGTLSLFTVSVQDKYGQGLVFFEGTFNISISLIPSVNSSFPSDFMRWEYLGNGSYVVSFSACEAGEKELQVQASIGSYAQQTWEHVPGSPFPLTVVSNRPRGGRSPLVLADEAATHGSFQGWPSSVSLEIKDICGNLPLYPPVLTHWNVTILRENDTSLVPLTAEILEDESKIIYHFTPSRTGKHLVFCFDLDLEPCMGAPLSIMVSHSAFPPPLDFSLSLIGVGNESYVDLPGQDGNIPLETKIFHLIAGQQIQVPVQVRDYWRDPIYSPDLREFVKMGMWRISSDDLLDFSNIPAASEEDCPRRETCNSAWTQELCAFLSPACIWDIPSSLCSSPPSCSSEKITFSSTVKRLGEYEFSSNVINASGTYVGRSSVYRPGGLGVQWFGAFKMDSGSLLCTSVLQGPIDHYWGSGPVGGCASQAYFSGRLLGYLRSASGFQEDYTFSLDTPCGVSLSVNHISYFDNIYKKQSIASFVAPLEPGMNFLRVDLNCTDNSMDRGSNYIRFWWGSASTSWQLIPAKALFWEEPLSRGMFTYQVHPLPLAAFPYWITNVEEQRGYSGDLTRIVIGAKDALGNTLRTRDVSAKLFLLSEPSLLEEQYRISPHSNATYVLDVYPGQATPHRLNITMEPRSSSIAATLWVEVNRAYLTNSAVLCSPASPQPAGRKVECTLDMRDKTGNVVQAGIHPFWGPIVPDLLLTSPTGNSEFTLPAAGVIFENLDEGLITDTFSFVPTVSGNWSLLPMVTYRSGDLVFHLSPEVFEVTPALSSPSHAETTLSISDVLHANRSVEFNVTAKDAFGNIAGRGGDLWRVLFYGPGNSVTAGLLQNDFGNGDYGFYANLSTPGSYTMRIDMVNKENAEDFSACPELILSFAFVQSLSNFRKGGSIASLACIEGYQPIVGEVNLRCDSKSRSWVGLDGSSVRPLLCGKIVKFCPPLGESPGREVLSVSWAREMGSEALLSCVDGFTRLLGDSQIKCGKAGWERRIDGAPADLLKCVPLKHWCPDLRLSVAGDGAEMISLSSGRQYGSEAEIRCREGFTRSEGNSSIWCGLNASRTGGEWKTFFFDADSQPVTAVPLKCEKTVDYCQHLPVKTNSYIKNHTLTGGFKLHERIEVGCFPGSLPRRGQDLLACLAPSEWKLASPELDGLVDIPDADWLTCENRQNFCPPLLDPHPSVALESLTNETEVRSYAREGCPHGYIRSSGDNDFFCGPQGANISLGAWLVNRTECGGNCTRSPLICQRRQDFCPEINVTNGFPMYFGGNNRTLDSKLMVVCDTGFTLGEKDDILLENPLTCGHQQDWMTSDGRKANLTDYVCRGRQHWCGRYMPPPGVRVLNFSDGLNRGSVVNVQCQEGWNITNATATFNSTFKAYCNESGLWDPIDSPTGRTVECDLIDPFCPREPPVYTSYNGTVQRAPSRFIQVEPMSTPYASRGGKMRVSCRSDLGYFDSFGDQDLVCGVDQYGRGEWKSSASGLPARALHCSNRVPYIQDYKYYNLSHGCLNNSRLPLHAPVKPYTTDSFGVTSFAGTISLWARTNCSVPPQGKIQFLCRLRALGPENQIVWGYQVTEAFVMKITENNRLHARVSSSCGDLKEDPGFNADIPLHNYCADNKWMHLVYSWDALADDENAEVYVNGIKTSVLISRRATPNCLLSTRNDAEQVGATFVFGDDHLTEDPYNIPGLQIAAISMYDRRLSALEISHLQYTQRPSCVDVPDLCPPLQPFLTNARVTGYGSLMDGRYPLHSRMREGWLEVSCNPGYLPSSGDTRLVCNDTGIEGVGGVWSTIGPSHSRTVGSPLQCCEQVKDWCPKLNTSSEKLTNMTYIKDFACRVGGGGGGGGVVGGGVVSSCALPTIENGNLVRSGLNPDVATLSCNAMFEPSTQISLTYFCRDGEWQFSDRTPATFSCRGIPNACPDPDPYFPYLRVVSLSDERRTGSLVVYDCQEGYDTVMPRPVSQICAINASWSGMPRPYCTRSSTFCPPLTYNITMWPKVNELLPPLNYSELHNDSSFQLPSAARGYSWNIHHFNRSLGDSLEFDPCSSSPFFSNLPSNPRRAVCSPSGWALPSGYAFPSALTCLHSPSSSVANATEGYTLGSNLTCLGNASIHAPLPSNNWTLSFFVRAELSSPDPNSTIRGGGSQVIFNNSNLSLVLSNLPVQGQIELNFSSLSENSTTRLANSTTWVHLALVFQPFQDYGNASLRFFVQGSQKNELRLPYSPGMFPFWGAPRNDGNTSVQVLSLNGSRISDLFTSPSVLSQKSIASLANLRPSCDKRCNMSSLLSFNFTKSYIKTAPIDFEFPGAQVHVECFKGYEPTEGDSVLTCQEDGSWQGTPLSCCLSSSSQCPSSSLNSMLTTYNAQIRSLEHPPPFTPSCPSSSSLFDFGCESGISPSAQSYEGTKAFLSCLPGYKNVTGSHPLECKDNQWKDLSHPLRCAPDLEFCPIPVVNNSELISATNGRGLGSVLSYKCRQGYMRVKGNEMISCIMNSTCHPHWTGEALQCIASSFLVEIDAENQVDSIASVECELGYIPVKGHQDDLVCGYNYEGEGGMWVDKTYHTIAEEFTRLECVKEDYWCPDPVNTSFALIKEVTDGRRVGSRAYLGCHRGFLPVSGDMDVTCGVNSSRAGEWYKSNDLLTKAEPLLCMKNQTFCPRVREEDMSVLVNYSFAQQLGAVVTFNCSLGYTPVWGDSVLTCGLSEKWVRPGDPMVEGQSLICSKVQTWCPEPEGFVAPFGYIESLSEGTRLYSRLHGKCRPGFIGTDGRDMVEAVCASDRTWRNISTHQPASWISCVRSQNYCPPISIPAGSAFPSTSLGFGDHLNMTCGTGYQVTLGHENLLCGKDGVYRLADGSNTEVLPFLYVHCESVLQYCPALNPVNARVTSYNASRQYQSIAHMSCLPGYSSVSGSDFAACTSDGTWSHPELSCQLSSSWCPSINMSLTNAFVNYTNGLKLLSTASFQCYGSIFERIVGENILFCRFNYSADASIGQWFTKAGAPFTLPFFCELPGIFGVELHGFPNPIFQYPALEVLNLQTFHVSGKPFDSSILHSWLYIPASTSRETAFDCQFFANGIGDMLLGVDQNVVLESNLTSITRVGGEAVSYPVRLYSGWLYELTLQQSLTLYSEFPDRDQNITLKWSCNGTGLPKGLIPYTYLYHSAGRANNPTTRGVITIEFSIYPTPFIPSSMLSVFPLLLPLHSRIIPVGHIPTDCQRVGTMQQTRDAAMFELPRQRQKDIRPESEEDRDLLGVISSEFNCGAFFQEGDTVCIKEKELKIKRKWGLAVQLEAPHGAKKGDYFRAGRCDFSKDTEYLQQSSALILQDLLPTSPPFFQQRGAEKRPSFQLLFGNVEDFGLVTPSLRGEHIALPIPPSHKIFLIDLKTKIPKKLAPKEKFSYPSSAVYLEYEGHPSHRFT